MKKLQLILLIILVSITSYTWFLDGYYQPINADTFAETSDTVMNVRFPEMLTAHTNYHARWFAIILPSMSFNTVGTIYNAITGNKAESLFVSQGFMTVISYVPFIFLSAYFISLCAAPLSSAFLLSYIFVSAFILIGGNLVYHYSPFTFRFYHTAVVGNYIWTFNVLMLTFLPYWRYYINSKWNDWHNNNYLKTLWLLIIIFCAFSSSCTTIIALFVACSILFVQAVYNFYNNQSANGFLKKLSAAIFKTKHEMYYGLYFLILLCAIGIIAERTGSTGQDSKTFFSNVNYIKQFKDYCYIWKEFLMYKPYIWAYSAVLVSAFAIGIYLLLGANKKNKDTAVKLILTAAFLLITALIYSFVIGTEQLPYRYRGTNLGGDTLLYFSWSLMFIILSITIYFIVNTKVKILAPLLIFVAISHILPSFSNYPYYIQQRKEMNGLNMITYLDKLNIDGPILLPESYHDVLNMWNLGILRLPGFAIKTRLTKTERQFKMVSDKEFLDFYSAYNTPLKDMISRY